MKVYFSGRFSRQAELCGYRHELEVVEDCIITVVSRWLDEPPPEEQSPGWQARVAAHDLEDIEDSDLFVAFTSGATATDSWRGGRHVELGYALALNRHFARMGCGPILIVGPNENVFHHLLSDEPDDWGLEHYDDWPETRERIIELARLTGGEE